MHAQSWPETFYPLHHSIKETPPLTSQQRIPSNSIAVKSCKETPTRTEQPRSQHPPIMIIEKRESLMMPAEGQLITLYGSGNETMLHSYQYGGSLSTPIIIVISGRSPTLLNIVYNY